MSVFLFHYWLLKVHCEVSIVLSIVLSSLILKVGRFGLLRVLVNLGDFKLWKLVNYLGFLGFVFYSSVLYLINDLKLMVAASSVVYINLSLMILSVDKILGLGLFLILNFYHRFRSLMMFWLRGLMYIFRNRRIFSLNRSITKLVNYQGLVVFIVFYFGINSPLNIRFVSEVMYLVLLGNLRLIILLMIFILLIVVFIYIVVYLVNLVYGPIIHFFVRDCISFNRFMSIKVFIVYVLFIFMKLEVFII